MTVKVKYENGVLIPIEKIELENDVFYEIEINKIELEKIKTIKPQELKNLCGIMSVGGDAVKDTEECFE